MASCLSVSLCRSVCLSVSVCDDEVSWSHRLEFFENNSTVSWPGMFALCRPQHHWPTVKGTPQNFGQNRGCGIERSGFGHTKALISLKRGKIGPRLLLRTNRKSHTCFQLVPTSMTLDDLEGSLCTLFQNTCTMRRHVVTYLYSFTYSLLLLIKCLGILKTDNLLSGYPFTG